MRLRNLYRKSYDFFWGGGRIPVYPTSEIGPTWVDIYTERKILINLEQNHNTSKRTPVYIDSMLICWPSFISDLAHFAGGNIDNWPLAIDQLSSAFL